MTNALPGGGRLRVLITSGKRARLENPAQVAAELDRLPDSYALVFTGLGATAGVQVPAHGPAGQRAGRRAEPRASPYRARPGQGGKVPRV